MPVKLSYFSVQDGNILNLEQRIEALLLLDIWPINLTGENGVVVGTCNNEQELRESLQQRGIE